MKKIKVKKFFKESNDLTNFSDDYVEIKMGYAEWQNILFYLQFGIDDSGREFGRILKEESEKGKVKWY